jgi:hypothetical protein
MVRVVVKECTRARRSRAPIPSMGAFVRLKTTCGMHPAPTRRYGQILGKLRVSIELVKVWRWYKAAREIKQESALEALSPSWLAPKIDSNTWAGLAPTCCVTESGGVGGGGGGGRRPER